MQQAKKKIESSKSLGSIGFQNFESLLPYGIDRFRGGKLTGGVAYSWSSSFLRPIFVSEEDSDDSPSRTLFKNDLGGRPFEAVDLLLTSRSEKLDMVSQM